MQDSQQYTIMSYFDAFQTGSDWVASDGKVHFAQTPMVEDIVVIQAMYGADTTTRMKIPPTVFTLTLMFGCSISR